MPALTETELARQDLERAYPGRGMLKKKELAAYLGIDLSTMHRRAKAYNLLKTSDGYHMPDIARFIVTLKRVSTAPKSKKPSRM